MLFTIILMRTMCHLQGWIYFKKHLHCLYKNGDFNNLVFGVTESYHLETVNRTASLNDWLLNLGEYLIPAIKLHNVSPS